MDDIREFTINPKQRLQVWRGADGRLQARLKGRVEIHCGNGRIHPNERIDVKWAAPPDDDGEYVDMLNAALNGDSHFARMVAHGLRIEWVNESWRDPCQGKKRRRR